MITVCKWVPIGEPRLRCWVDKLVSYMDEIGWVIEKCTCPTWWEPACLLRSSGTRTTDAISTSGSSKNEERILAQGMLEEPTDVLGILELEREDWCRGRSDSYCHGSRRNSKLFVCPGPSSPIATLAIRFCDLPFPLMPIRVSRCGVQASDRYMASSATGLGAMLAPRSDISSSQ